MQAQDLEHLKLLSIFHLVLGGLTALFALVPVLHLVLGLALLSGRIEADGDARLAGWIVTSVAVVLLTLGLGLAAAMLFAARSLARRRSRTACLVVAGLECLIVPWGTVLGVFTIVVLQRPSVIALFDGEAAAPPAAGAS